MSCAGCPGPSPAISTQFTLKMCVAAENRKNSLKTLILGVQGHSKSWTLTLIKSLSQLLVIISSMSVSICNRFYTIQANNGKITSFWWSTFWRSHSREIPAPTGTKFCHYKLEFLWQPSM